MVTVSAKMRPRLQPRRSVRQQRQKLVALSRCKAPQARRRCRGNISCTPLRAPQLRHSWLSRSALVLSVRRRQVSAVRRFRRCLGCMLNVRSVRAIVSATAGKSGLCDSGEEESDGDGLIDGGLLEIGSTALKPLSPIQLGSHVPFGTACPTLRARICNRRSSLPRPIRSPPCANKIHCAFFLGIILRPIASSSHSHAAATKAWDR
jgi:hypothetical protein